MTGLSRLLRQDSTSPCTSGGAGELFDHRRRTKFKGDGERVFCSQRGNAIDPKRYAETLRLASSKAKIDRPVRPFHDGRHSSITNGAAEGLSPGALMARAGHSDLATTQLYIDLAGEAFRDEAERLGARVFADVVSRGRLRESGPSRA